MFKKISSPPPHPHPGVNSDHCLGILVWLQLELLAAIWPGSIGYTNELEFSVLHKEMQMLQFLAKI